MKGSIAELLYAEFTANKQAETVMIAALCKYAHADDAIQQAQTIYKVNGVKGVQQSLPFIDLRFIPVHLCRDGGESR